jgi:hypothetical protein
MACGQDIYVDHEQQIVDAYCGNRGCLHDWSTLIGRTMVLPKTKQMSVWELALISYNRLCSSPTKIV